MVKPVPVSAAALIVRGPVPLEVKITDLTAGELTVTLPKARLVVLTLMEGVAVLS
jgi:hypothetical protein